ncbi:MAG: MoaD/ThiS family protein, partial [Alphaproteobacteria bacterium]|nr:MoaD/ThiS family protein [Alphaproteobacteria bacterium]
MRIRYFAWIREHAGCSEEQLALPAAVLTVSDLIDHLSSVSDGHALALKNRKNVRVAV